MWMFLYGSNGVVTPEAEEAVFAGEPATECSDSEAVGEAAMAHRGAPGPQAFFF